MSTSLLTALALIGFAANSIFCRMALGESHLDPASFTSIRLLSGAIALYILIQFKRPSATPIQSTLSSRTYAPIMLFIYASTFSFAYVNLNTGTGAIILYGAVHMTMMSVSIFAGNRPPFKAWLGMLIAFSGFVYLMLPSASMPSLQGFFLMTIAGIAWGIYSMLGQTSHAPLWHTQHNFLYALPFTIALSFWFIDQNHLSNKGVLLAIVSGALASGIGYALWYTVLKKIPTSLAASLQLLVPFIATVGGFLWLDEHISLHFSLAALMILSGIFIILKNKSTVVKR
ncbi:MAG: DMT family transporter [Mariprofundaceae bacterium]|nr:DMT family transporter [Mariprofundaceae bacterium]